MNSLTRITNRLKPAIKLHWWRLEGSTHGNFGDEITKLIISRIFGRRVEWSPADQCDMIGAGSIIEEVTANKGANRPYLWSSGFIQEGDLTISDADYKIIGVRGKQSLQRVTSDTSSLQTGDAGLLASYLLKDTPKKQYTLGILPHYVDIDHPIVQQLAAQDTSVVIIDATWPCEKVVETIAQCDMVLSSSLHGLIVSDSVATPNVHFKLSDKLKGGSYKFNDYYSIYQDTQRYHIVTPEMITGKTAQDILAFTNNLFVSVSDDEMKSIKQRLIDSFPLV